MTTPAGFVFPPPEGTTLFPPQRPDREYAGCGAGTHSDRPNWARSPASPGTPRVTIGSRFDQFDDDDGRRGAASGRERLPQRADPAGGTEAPECVTRLPAPFGRVFPEVAAGGPIDFTMFGRAIAEFEFTLVFADAPIDSFARVQQHGAMIVPEKEGALIFFGKGKCLACHTSRGQSNEMFSDFRDAQYRRLRGIAPDIRRRQGQRDLRGARRGRGFRPRADYRHSADYKFRSSPLRNVSLQPAFFHNGAFTRIEDAIRHHLDVEESVHR